jgi:murein hydrolase activator
MASLSSESRPTQSAPRGLICAVFAVFVVIVVVAAQQSDRERTEALAKRAADRLQGLQREADALASTERTLLSDLRRLEVDREIKATELKQADEEAGKIQADLDETVARTTALESAAAAERPELRARLLEVYKLGQARYLRLLLSTPDLRRIGQATRVVAAMAKLDRDRVAAHKRTLAELNTTRTALEARSVDAARSRTTAAKAEVAAEHAEQARNDLIRQIDQKRDLNAQLTGELMSAQQKLQATLKEIASGAAPATAPSLPLKPFRGDLDWPAAGSVRHRFGHGSASSGIEIAAEEGADAHAIHDGVVAFAGPFSGFGNLVIVEHGAQTFSLYGNLLDLSVAKGARIEGGQAVGTVGPTAAGPAGLYFELRVDGQPVDPLQWLKKR